MTTGRGSTGESLILSEFAVSANYCMYGMATPAVRGARGGASQGASVEDRLGQVAVMEPPAEGPGVCCAQLAGSAVQGADSGTSGRAGLVQENTADSARAWPVEARVTIFGIKRHDCQDGETGGTLWLDPSICP